MHSMVSGGAAARITARTFCKVERAGSATRARYSSTSRGVPGLGADLDFAVELAFVDFCFFMRLADLDCASFCNSQMIPANKNCSGQASAARLAAGRHKAKEIVIARQRSPGQSIAGSGFTCNSRA